MSARVLVVFESGRYKARTSSAETIDFLSIKVGASGLEIKETASHFDFSAKKLQNIADGTVATDAASKGQLDTAVGLRVLKAGDTMTGALDFGGTQKVTGLAAPSSANDAARKVYVDDADALRVLKAGDTMSGNLNMGGNAVTNLGAPSAATDAARKSYVDALVNGLDVKPSIRAATTAALPASTYANGTLGVGATLTANANGALAAQDGVTLIVNDRLLVKNQAAGLQNGLYKVTQVGDGGTPFILTRVVDSDEAAEISGGMFAFIEEGTLYADTGWVCTVDGAVTMGTTALTFAQFSSAGVITAGNGLTQTGNTFDVNVDDSTIEINVDTLRVKDLGITAAKLAADSVTTVKILDANVTTDKIADDAITIGKMADDSVSTDEIQDTSVTGAKLNSDVGGNDPFHTGIWLNETDQAAAFIEAVNWETWQNDEASPVTVRQVMYVKPTSGNANLAGANEDEIEDAFLAVVKDASINAAASGRMYFRPGVVIPGFTGLVQGSRYYVSRTTPGAITADLSGFVAGEHVYQVGIALSGTDLMFDPKYVIEIA